MRNKNFKKAMKELHGRKKAEYIWEYYSFHIMVALIAAVLVIVTVYQALNTDKTYAQIVVINATDEENCRIDLQKSAENDMDIPEGYTLTVDPSIEYNPENQETADAEDLQVLAAKVMTGEADLLVGNTALFDSYSANGGLKDLSDILDSESIEEYQNRFYYASDSDGKQIAAGIWITDGSPLFTASCTEEQVLVGIISQSADQEADAAVLKWLVQ